MLINLLFGLFGLFGFAIGVVLQLSPNPEHHINGLCAMVVCGFTAFNNFMTIWSNRNA